MSNKFNLFILYTHIQPTPLSLFYDVEGKDQKEKTLELPGQALN